MRGPGGFGADAADVLDRAAGAVGALRELAREVVRAAEEVGVGDLLLADLVEVGRRDATAGGAARFVGQDVDAVVLPREVEQAVREIGDERAFVDQQPGENRVALLLERARLPPELARVGDHAAADAQVGGVLHDDAGGEQVQLDAAGRVAGVGAAVDLEHDGDRVRGAAQFVGDLGNQAAFAFVAEGNTDVGDELAGEGKQGHGCGGHGAELGRSGARISTVCDPRFDFAGPGGNYRGAGLVHRIVSLVRFRSRRLRHAVHREAGTPTRLAIVSPRAVVRATSGRPDRARCLPPTAANTVASLDRYWRNAAVRDSGRDIWDCR
jgi:hypothetical protein